MREKQPKQLVLTDDLRRLLISVASILIELMPEDVERKVNERKTRKGREKAQANTSANFS